jgi:hypothetical protein
VAGNDVGLDVNADKTKYMVMSREQKAGRCYNVKTDSRPFERVEKLGYLGKLKQIKNLFRNKLRAI